MNVSSAGFDRYAQPLRDFWTARNARERRLLSIAIAAVALALLYWVLIEPALSGREQLSKTLPQLRQQVAEMQALSKEAAALRNTETPEAEPLSRNSVEAALSRNGLKAQNLNVNGDMVVVQLSSVSSAQLLSWLGEMHKASPLLVVESNIVAQDQPGIVNATLTLRQPKSE